MSNDKAWLIISTDISRETDYTVFLNEHVATEALGLGIRYLANEDLERISWDEEDAAALRSIIKAADEKRWDDVTSEWDDWRRDKGPLDDDVEMVMIDLIT